MKIVLAQILVLSSVIFSLGTAYGQVREDTKPAEGGIVTLYAKDPLGQSLCFYDGGNGQVIKEGQVWNRCSHLNFNSYNSDGFTVGVQGSEKGVIWDLGTPHELQSKYGYGETVTLGQGFASITVSDGRAYILKDRRARTLQPIDGSDLLFAEPEGRLNTAPVMSGHIYILRVITGTQKDSDIFAKIIVLAHVPNESVTLRWLPLALADRID